MAERYTVKNLQEALELARKFKKEGKYDLFRGQSHNWTVRPSAARLTDHEFEEVKKKIVRLYDYFLSDPVLDKIRKDIDAFYAIAQHYGVPTFYLDFTSSVEVAAYFATNSKSNKPGEDCVIICLNKEDFDDFIKITNSLYKKYKAIPPYIKQINVSNLWRLQAQQGCVLFTQIDIEKLYDFDRIIFPFIESFKDIAKENIYPERKSELEILLDHYFNKEKRIAGQKRLEKLVKKLKMKVAEFPSQEPDKFLKKRHIHSSWRSKTFKEWQYTVKEEWKEANFTQNIAFKVSFEGSLTDQVSFIFNQLMQYFEMNEVSRTGALKFKVKKNISLKPKTSVLIAENCERIWDGTRNLPFTDTEICHLISKYACLEMHRHEYGDVPSLSGEKLITLELMNEYGSITRCKVTASKLASAFRPDIKEIVIEELGQNISPRILLNINIPNLLFDFKKLLALFKDELIPYQVVHNSRDTHPVIFYTPTQISILGYA